MLPPQAEQTGDRGGTRNERTAGRRIITGSSPTAGTLPELMGTCHSRVDHPNTVHGQARCLHHTAIHGIQISELVFAFILMLTRRPPLLY
jgi:hypothetical protein